MKVEIIRTTGTSEQHDIPFNEVPDQLKTSQIATFEIGDGRTMVLDSVGTQMKPIEFDDDDQPKPAEREPKPVNEKATAMYRAVAGSDQAYEVRGDVAILNASDI